MTRQLNNSVNSKTIVKGVQGTSRNLLDTGRNERDLSHINAAETY